MCIRMPAFKSQSTTSMVLKEWTLDQRINITSKSVRNTNSQTPPRTGSKSLETEPSKLCFSKMILMHNKFENHCSKSLALSPGCSLELLGEPITNINAGSTLDQLRHNLLEWSSTFLIVFKLSRWFQYASDD